MKSLEILFRMTPIHLVVHHAVLDLLNRRDHQGQDRALVLDQGRVLHRSPAVTMKKARVNRGTPTRVSERHLFNSA